MNISQNSIFFPSYLKIILVQNKNGTLVIVSESARGNQWRVSPFRIDVGTGRPSGSRCLRSEVDWPAGGPAPPPRELGGEVGLPFCWQQPALASVVPPCRHTSALPPRAWQQPEALGRVRSSSFRNPGTSSSFLDAVAHADLEGLLKHHQMHFVFSTNSFQMPGLFVRQFYIWSAVPHVTWKNKGKTGNIALNAPLPLLRARVSSATKRGLGPSSLSRLLSVCLFIALSAQGGPS